MVSTAFFGVALRAAVGVGFVAADCGEAAATVFAGFFAAALGAGIVFVFAAGLDAMERFVLCLLELSTRDHASR
jgi:hypothetical protein